MEYEVIKEVGDRVYVQTGPDGIITWAVLALCVDGIERELYVNEEGDYWE